MKCWSEIGIEDAGEIVALATTEQIVTAFDEDLFVNARPGDLTKTKPVAPHAVNLLCSWAVMTRYKQPDPEYYDSAQRGLIARLDPRSKARLYEDEPLPTSRYWVAAFALLMLIVCLSPVVVWVSR